MKIEARRTLRKRIWGARRRGMGVLVALLVVVVGSVLVGGIFALTYTASHLSQKRGEIYSDQMLISSRIERAKGSILASIDEAQVALHASPRGLQWKSRPPIYHLNELMIDGAFLSFDETIEKARRRIILNVFDVTYIATQIASPLREDLKDMPPMLAVLPPASADPNIEMENEGFTEGDIERNDPLDDYDNAGINLDLFGAYLIRTQIFNTEIDSNKAYRVTEEAFFQILSRDTP